MVKLNFELYITEICGGGKLYNVRKMKSASWEAK